MEPRLTNQEHSRQRILFQKLPPFPKRNHPARYWVFQGQNTWQVPCTDFCHFLQRATGKLVKQKHHPQKKKSYIHTYIHNHTFIHTFPSTHAPTHTHPSIQPSVHPSVRPSIHPSINTVIQTCRLTDIQPEYCSKHSSTCTHAQL